MTNIKFLALSCAVGLILGVTSYIVNFQSQQKELADIEKKPQIYEVGTHADCDLQYIRTSHKESTNNSKSIYKEDVYLKSVCDDSVSLTKVKGNISFTRMKILSANEVDSKKPKM